MIITHPTYVKILIVMVIILMICWVLPYCIEFAEKARSKFDKSKNSNLKSNREKHRLGDKA